MGLEKLTYLDLLNPLEKSQVVIQPVSYEGGVSYGTGTKDGPEAILKASPHLEFYDEIYKIEPYKIGIYTEDTIDSIANENDMYNSVYQNTKKLLEQEKFIITVGGDHSITPPALKAHIEKFNHISCIQFDAHSDLRDEYEGSKNSHACAMARVREFTRDTLQLGIRSMSMEEAKLIERENISLYTMHTLYRNQFNIDQALTALPDPVYITFDVDAFDWSVVRSTGTPEPGGFTWEETMRMLEKIFSQKNVIGCDIVELSHNPHDPNSPFAVAKLIYKMIAMKFRDQL